MYASGQRILIGRAACASSLKVSLEEYERNCGVRCVANLAKSKTFTAHNLRIYI